MITTLKKFFHELGLNRSIRSKFIVASYRISRIYYLIDKKFFIYKIFFILPVIIHYLVVEFIFGVEIKPKTKIGWGLTIFHPQGIIINPHSEIGCNCIIRHGVTIGNKYNRRTRKESLCPVLGDDIEIGAMACIVGPIHIGDRVRIGALALVDFDVLSDSIVFGVRASTLESKNFS